MMGVNLRLIVAELSVAPATKWAMGDNCTSISPLMILSSNGWGRRRQ